MDTRPREEIMVENEEPRGKLERLQLVQQAGCIGTFDWNVTTNQITWTKEMECLYGMEPGCFRGSHEAWECYVHPDDLPSVKTAFRRGLEERTCFQTEFRILRPDQDIHWIAAWGNVICDDKEQPLRMVGINIDITERKRMDEALFKSNQRLDLLAETASQLLKSNSPQDVVDALCRKVLTFLDCDAFFNYLVDDEKKRLHLNSCGGIPEEDARRMEWLDYGVGLCGCSARDGCRLVVNNLQETDDQYTALVKPFGIRAYACHPLIAQGRVIGTLSFCTRTRACFSDDELSLMKAVADHVAIAIDRKRTEEELHRAHVELEKRVAERTHELNMQGIELEVQNRKLRETQNELKMSRDRFSNLYDFAPVGYITLSDQGIVSEINLAGAEMLAVERSLLIGKSFKYFLAEDCRAKFHAHIMRGMETHTPISIELSLSGKNGEERIIQLHSVLHEDIEGMKQLLCAILDITEKKKTEQALRDSEQELSFKNRVTNTLLTFPGEEMYGEVMQIVLEFMHSEYGIFAYLNEEGAIVASSLTRVPWDKGHVTGRVTWNESNIWCRSIIGKQSLYSNALSQVTDGIITINRVLVTPIIFQDEVIGHFEVANKAEDYDEQDRQKLEIIADIIAPVLHSRLQRDIQEQRRKIAECDLQKNKEKLHAIFTANFIGIICFDIHGNITFANDKFLDIVGYTRDDLNAGLIRWTDITPPEFLHLSKMHIDEAMSGGSCSPYEKQYIRKDGTRVWVLVGFVLKGERHDEGEAFVIDITDRKEAEEAAIESERKISTLTGNLPGMVYRCRNDQDWTMEFVSGGCRELTGYKCEDLIGNKAISYGDIICPEDRDAVWDKIQYALQARRAFEFSYRIKTAPGKIKWVWEKGVGVFSTENKLLALEGFISDITEHKQLEMQLLQAQKMEAIGILSGGIAHDFNNIINVIIGYASLMEEKIAEEDCDCLEQIIIAAERAAGLTNSLLAFSRKQVIELRSIKLNEVVQKTKKLLNILLREDIELVINLSDNELVVMADTGQIEQVLVNLTTNALDAMPNGGLLTISTAKRDIDLSFIQSHGYGEIGEYAMLAFSDTGCGMDETSRQKMFEPFFTTKEVGKGTGLGLSIVYGIIKQHNGFINCYSEPGKGSSFKIYLPLSSTTQEQIETNTTIPPQKGTETILLAEDDGSTPGIIQESSRRIWIFNNCHCRWGRRYSKVQG